MKYLLFTMLLVGSIPKVWSQGIDETLSNRIGVGDHSSHVKTISGLLGVALRSHAAADVLRFKNVTNVEFFNGTSWVAYSTEDWKNVLDGVDGNAWTITNNKVRFTIDLEGSWLRPSAYLIGQDWNSGEQQYIFTVESSNDQSTWVTNLDPTPSGSSTALNLFMITSGWRSDRFFRLTFESSASSSNPLQLLQVSAFNKRFVGLKNNSSLPFQTNFDGNVGLGTTSPSYAKLQIRGGATHELLAVNRPNSDVPALYLGNDGTDNAAIVSNNSDLTAGRDYGGIYTEYLRVQNNTGNVGIGTTSPNAKLEVAGDIHSQEVQVRIDAGTGPDYVFEADYNLATIEEIESFIKSNKHLPEIPSAKEMEANGVQLGEMNMLLLKKIEELTLHLINEHKENSELRNQVKTLEARSQKLEGENSALNERFATQSSQLEAYNSQLATFSQQLNALQQEIQSNQSIQSGNSNRSNHSEKSNNSRQSKHSNQSKKSN